MAYEEDGAGRLHPHGAVHETSNGSLVSSSRLLLLKRRLERAKRPTTYQQHPNPVKTQKKKLDGYLEKTQSKLTITTAETSCSSSLTQSHVNHSFDYPISRWPSQQTFGDDTYGSDSKEGGSFATFALASHAKDAAEMFKEWRTLYSISAENSENYADDEADDNQEEFDDETADRHPDTRTQHQADVGQVIIDGSPSDLLSAQLTIESSTDTMSTVKNDIPTPSGTCSFNFNFFESVAKVVTRMTSQGANDDDSEYSDDNSSCNGSANSGASEENNLIPNKLLHYDEGETKVAMNWTYDASEAGSADSDL